MYNLLEKIFWNVLVNKIRLKLWHTQRNPVLKTVYLFINKLIVKFDATDNIVVKSLLLATPIINVFIFWWLFSFIFVIIIDIAYIHYVMKD